MTTHNYPCYGYHEPTVSCEEAVAYREEERIKLFFCPKSTTGDHAFMGDTMCAHGCGRNVQELFPEDEYY